MFLKPEILKLTNAYETFEALGKEFPNFGDILSKSHVSGSPTLLAILDKLSRMELVRKARPVNDEKKQGITLSIRCPCFISDIVFNMLRSEA